MNSPNKIKAITKEFLKSNITDLSLHVLITLTLGGMIYISWRPSSLVMFRWIESIGLNPIVTILRDNLETGATHVAHWILYSLPQGLWIYSLTIFLGMIWYDYASWCRTIILIYSLFISISVEMLQLLDSTPGTFDIADLALNISASIVAITVLWMKYDRKEAIC
jgi:hypothetical protein